MLLLIILTAHFLGDFLLQNNAIASNKSKSTKMAFKHIFIHFLLIAILVLIYEFFDSPLGSIIDLNEALIVGIVLVIHFLTDRFLKEVISKRFNNNFNSLLFDQIIHLIVIYLTFYFLRETDLTNFLGVINSNYNLPKIYLSVLFAVLLLPFSNHLIQSIFIYLNKGEVTSNEEVKIIEKTVDNKTEIIKEKTILSKQEVTDYGKWIGYMERILVFTLVLLSSFEGILIVIALKTFARFRQLNNKSFVEKYLLGTLFSITLALLLGLLFKYIMVI